jgi:hypothetical protein
VEASLSTENWTEERARLAKLLEAVELGKLWHLDRNRLEPLQPRNEPEIVALRARLAELNARLGE